MIEWRYWRWQILRHVPLGVTVFFVVAISGLFALQAIPKGFQAESHLVLETPLALGNTPKGARASQDIQHLQMVMHGLLSDEKNLDATLDLSIKSARDKPTLLIVQSRMLNRDRATTQAREFATRAVKVSNALQRERIDASLSKLAELEREQAKELALAQQEFSAFQPQGTEEFADLEIQLERLTDQLNTAKSAIQSRPPEIEKLKGDLEREATVFSETHPRIKLLKAQLAKAEQEVAMPDTKTLDTEISEVSSRLAEAREQANRKDSLKKDVLALSASYARAQDALTSARLKGEASFARLKLIKDADTQPTTSAKKQLAAQIALLALAFAAAAGVIALRIKLDRRVRRPADLAKGLGITPFATLPDLGPSLT